MTWAAHSGTAQAARCLAQTCLALQALPPAMPALPPAMPALRPASPRHHGASCLWYQARPVRPLRPGHQLQLGISLTGPDIPPLLKVQAVTLLLPVQPHQKPIHKVRTVHFLLMTALYIPLQSFATDRSYPFALRAVLQVRSGLRRTVPERTGLTAAQRTAFFLISQAGSHLSKHLYPHR